jgi:hypothetical protein
MDDRGRRIPQVRLIDAAGRLKRIFGRVQAALDAAEAGDRVIVPDGRHVGDLRVSADITLTGTNFGVPGVSPQRGIESTIMGRIIIGHGAASAVIDGLMVWGGLDLLPGTTVNRRFVLRNCVIDGRDGGTAIAVARGTASGIFDNLILGGDEAAVRIACGFDDLSIRGNRIESAHDGVGVFVSGGPDPDRITLCSNTFLGGSYGVLFQADSGFGRQGDAVLLSDNQFGESRGGAVQGAPRVAAVHADGASPAWLEVSHGLTFQVSDP